MTPYAAGTYREVEPGKAAMHAEGWNHCRPGRVAGLWAKIRVSRELGASNSGLLQQYSHPKRRSDWGGSYPVKFPVRSAMMPTVPALSARHQHAG